MKIREQFTFEKQSPVAVAAGQKLVKINKYCVPSNAMMDRGLLSDGDIADPTANTRHHSPTLSVCLKHGG